MYQLLPRSYDRGNEVNYAFVTKSEYYGSLSCVALFNIPYKVILTL